MVGTVASQREGSWSESQLGPFCVEFACSPRVKPTKNMHVRLIGDSKLALGVTFGKLKGHLQV